HCSGGTVPPREDYVAPVGGRRIDNYGCGSAGVGLAERKLLGFGVAYKDYIGIRVAADQAEVFPIRRPQEIVNVFRLEVSDFPSGSTRQRIQPNVIHVIITAI